MVDSNPRQSIVVDSNVKLLKLIDNNRFKIIEVYTK